MPKKDQSLLPDRGGRKYRILLVDDDRFFLEIFTDLIREMGHEPLIACDGNEALEKARRLAPDLVITDVVMPGLSGFEVTERIKNDPVTTHIPVVIITSLSDRASRIEGLARGADELLTKPVDEAEFRVRVRNLLKVKSYEDYLLDQQKTLKIKVEKKTVELDEAYEKIKSGYLETVYRLTLAAEFRDSSTGEHIKRIGLYSELLAEKLGLDATFRENIRYASPMHDVGKIGIPDSVLLKAGRFSDEDFDIMKAHCTIGANILHNPGPDILKTAMEIALSHHERWDGSGYPRGLKGEEIPISGRITHIVDVYDALRSERPYKPAYDHQKTLKIMNRNERHGFDPEIMKVFLNNADGFNEIYEKNKD